MARLRHLALAVGGAVGVRLTPPLPRPVSGDTLLRWIQREPLPSSAVPRVIGVDDWAYCKGQRYATLIVDLERRRPIALLPDRTVETVAAWLRQHPQIELVTRDRAPDYARAIADGAPQAIQVADRWHLLANLREVLERVLERLHSTLRLSLTTSAFAATAPEPALGTHRTAVAIAQRHQRRERRQEHFLLMRDLHQQGWSMRELARHFGMSRSTVQRYVSATRFRAAIAHAPRASQLDPYLAYLQAQWEVGHRSGVVLWRAIQAQGYHGSCKRVYQWLEVQKRREAEHHAARAAQEAYSAATAVAPLPLPLPLTLPAPRQLVWLFLQPRTSLRPAQQLLYTHLCQHPEVQTAAALSERFCRLLRERDADGLTSWLDDCSAASTELQAFARVLQQEFPSIHAACSVPWSNEHVAYCTSSP